MGRVRVDRPRISCGDPPGSRPIGSGERPRCRGAARIGGFRLRRRGRDSNPRCRGYPHNGFRDRPIQPLSHPSGERLWRVASSASDATRKNARRSAAHSARQQASGDLRAVVETRLGEDVEDRAGGAGLRVGGAVDDARDAAEHDRARAHRARLERHVEHRLEQPPGAERAGAPRGSRSSRRGRSGPGAARARCGRRRSPRRRARRPRRPARRRARARARPRAARAA